MSSTKKVRSTVSTGKRYAPYMQLSSQTLCLSRNELLEKLKLIYPPVEANSKDDESEEEAPGDHDIERHNSSQIFSWYSEEEEEKIKRLVDLMYDIAVKDGKPDREIVEALKKIDDAYLSMAENPDVSVLASPQNLELMDKYPGILKFYMYRLNSFVSQPDGGASLRLAYAKYICAKMNDSESPEPRRFYESHLKALTTTPGFENVFQDAIESMKN